MIYCDLRRLATDDPVPLTVDNLFPVTLCYDDFDTALNRPINVPASTVTAPSSPRLVAETNWYSGSDLSGYNGVSVGYLDSCAAILIYDFQGLLRVGHPSGGQIDPNKIKDLTPDTVTYAIYASPDIRTRSTKSREVYKESISLLAQYCGTENVCFIDGFPIGGNVLANLQGGFICPGKRKS